MSKILLVEDEEQLRAILVRRLERRGYQVITTGNGELGCALARSERPELILMDLNLELEESPIDGLEATRRLKGEEATGAIPVIALTALADDMHEEAVKAGCDDYERKPIDFPRLLEKIQVYLQRSTTP